jgi:hypothetical protein
MRKRPANVPAANQQRMNYEVAQFVGEQKQKAADVRQMEAERKMAAAREEASYASKIRQRFNLETLPAIVELDKQGIKHFEIGRFHQRPPAVWSEIARENGMFIRGSGPITSGVRPTRAFSICWR